MVNDILIMYLMSRLDILDQAINTVIEDMPKELVDSTDETTVSCKVLDPIIDYRASLIRDIEFLKGV